MKEAKKEAGRKFVQVSLSQDFAAEVRAQSEAADRSMAAQLEHWAKIARAIEAVIPAPTLSELKAGVDASEVLSRVGAYLVQQNPAKLLSYLEAVRAPRYGIDEADPDIAVRIEPDGTQTRGKFDAAGNFVPAPVATARMGKHDRKSEVQQSPRGKAQGGAAARAPAAGSRKRSPVAV